MALRVTDFLGETDSISISRAILYAVDHGARVINISYGGAGTTHVEQQAIAYAASHGVLVVIAAGNQAVELSGFALTGSAAGALTVAGTTVDDARAPFSNWGATVDLAAPATDILGLRARGTDFLRHSGERSDYRAGTAIVGDENDLYRATGTSFAAAFVSGTASLIWSLNPKLTRDEVRAMLLSSATDIELPGTDSRSGVGRLDAAAALRAEPAGYLDVRISRLQTSTWNGEQVVEVHGHADGPQFETRWLQAAYGEPAEPKDWLTVSTSTDAIADGLLGRVPLRRLDRRGTWTVRILARDRSQKLHSAMGRITAE